MASISHSLYKENKKSGTAEISIRFCGGKGDGLTVRTGTLLYIQPHRWGSDNKIIIPRLATKERAEILNISEKLECLDRHIVNEFNNIDRQVFSKEWLIQVIHDFHNPPQPTVSKNDMQLLNYVDTFVKSAPKRLNKRDGVILRPNALQQYKATQKHLKNFIVSEKKIDDLDFKDINEDFYKDFVLYLQKLNFRQNTVGKHIRIFKTMLNDAPPKYRNECDLSKFKVFNVDVDNVYLSEEELKKLWETDLSNNSDVEVARDWFLIACWSGSRYSDLYQFTDIRINKDKKFIEIKQEKTSTNVSIPIHPIVTKIYEKYNWKLPELPNNQDINPNIRKAVELAGIDDIVSIERSEGGKKVKCQYKKFELIGTHTGRRSFCTNNYLLHIPVYQIMAVSGHKTEKSFLKYIKVKPKEYSEMMSKEWEKIYSSSNPDATPENEELLNQINELSNERNKLKAHILDMTNERDELNNQIIKLRKEIIKLNIDLRDFSTT